MKQEPAGIPGDDEKRRLYAEAATKLGGLVEGEVDLMARMAAVAAVLHGLMPHFYWTGFYRVIGSQLVIGPYQGTPGCLRIGWGKGVCGTAWKTGVTQVVPDVHAFPDHIACDSASESEVVVPLKDGGERVLAVLDVDSTLPGAFGPIDAEELESIVRMFVSPAEAMC